MFGDPLARKMTRAQYRQKLKDDAQREKERVQAEKERERRKQRMLLKPPQTVTPQSFTGEHGDKYHA